MFKTNLDQYFNKYDRFGFDKMVPKSLPRPKILNDATPEDIRIRARIMIKLLQDSVMKAQKNIEQYIKEIKEWEKFLQ